MNTGEYEFASWRLQQEGAFIAWSHTLWSCPGVEISPEPFSSLSLGVAPDQVSSSSDILLSTDSLVASHTVSFPSSSLLMKGLGHQISEGGPGLQGRESGFSCLKQSLSVALTGRCVFAHAAISSHQLFKG